MRPPRFPAAGCLLAALPIVLAFSTARQELLAAMHTRPRPDNGAELFRNCAICHGSDGGGTLDGGVPRIAGQHMSVVAKQLVDYRHDKRWDVRMEHFADRHHLADAQAIADIASFVHQLSVNTAPGVGDGQLLGHGAEVYARLCRTCHGPTAQGSGVKWVPRLAGQHYEYIMRQIYYAADGRRPNFTLAHVRLAAGLSREDIVGVADYLARLPADQAAPNGSSAR